MCFVNAVWQLLLLVPPFVHVLRAVSAAGATHCCAVDHPDEDACKFMTTTHLFAAANRHFSLSHPFPSSLPVHAPSSLFYNRFSALTLS